MNFQILRVPRPLREPCEWQRYLIGCSSVYGRVYVQFLTNHWALSAGKKRFLWEVMYFCLFVNTTIAIFEGITTTLLELVEFIVYALHKHFKFCYNLYFYLRKHLHLSPIISNPKKEILQCRSTGPPDKIGDYIRKNVFKRQPNTHTQTQYVWSCFCLYLDHFNLSGCDSCKINMQQLAQSRHRCQNLYFQQRNMFHDGQFPLF